MTDTIYALASGNLPAGVAVIRVSGPQAFEVAEQLAGQLPPPKQTGLRTIRRRNGEILDQALVLTFQSPASFTGEDCVELHLHGSRAVAAAVYEELSLFPGLRLAEAGEFSRRAFENGKLDLVEIEGLADLIASETEMQRRLAVEQSFGGQSELYMGWATHLTRLRALIEAELDFSDEEDVPGSVSDQVWPAIRDLKAEMDRHIANARSAEILRDGFKVVISGPPNAGKSSLLNYLANRDVAIVTDIAGTTRDILHIDVDMEGYLVRFFDTAGIRESDDVVEREGIRRAMAALAQADLVLRLSEKAASDLDSFPKQIDSESPASAPVLRISTKTDRGPRLSGCDLAISVKTGDGMEELRRRILDMVRSHWTGSAVPGRQRQVSLLKESSNFLEEALNAGELDIRAESLRAAATSLGRITGRVDVEQLLDVIFSQFCIGK